MNDYETVALIAGGHTFGKTHGAAPATHVGPEPEGGNLEEQGRLEGRLRDRQRRPRDHQRSRSDLDHDARQVEQRLLQAPVRVRLGVDRESGGREAVEAEERRGAGTVPAAPRPDEDRAGHADHGPRASARSGLRENRAPLYENPQEFADAFAKAWFKLTHRDMGPITRYLGPEVPKEPQIWQDPCPGDARTDRREGHRQPLKEKILASGLSVSAGLDRLGVRIVLPRHRQARGGATAPGSVLRRRRIGPSTTRQSWRRC